VDAPRPTTAAPPDELLELVQSLRHELIRRDEMVAGNWVEETAGELRKGRKVGWYYPSVMGGGLAFYSARGGDAFGHVHVLAGPDPGERARRLAETMLDSLPPALGSIDVGFTGLDPETERALTTRLSARPGSKLIERLLMERGLGRGDDEGPIPTPPGLVLVPVRSVTLDALADLDRRAFVGTVDELLIGRTHGDYRHVLEALLDGELGRFVDEASTALIAPEPTRLVGALLTGEQSARRAIFLDFVVDPRDRGRGFGRFLFRWGLRALTALGYSSVRLWVTSSNAAARHLYDEVGFRVAAAASIYRWDRPGSSPQAHSGR
jgi:ribosomal protein S18 acetylase RimI-like enzyme